MAAVVVVQVIAGNVMAAVVLALAVAVGHIDGTSTL